MPLTILLIDKDAERAEAIEKKLGEDSFARVVRSHAAPGTSGADLAQTVAHVRPDLIIVDMALPDRDALDDLRGISSDHPVVMFAGSDDPAFAEEAIDAGVCSYNMSGVALQDVKPVLASAIALFRRYRQVETELAAAKAQLDERRLVERAKAILMQGRRLSEPEAYNWLRKKAMNENRKLAQVAAEFITEHEAKAASDGERKVP